MKNNFYNKTIFLAALFLVLCLLIFLFFYREINKNKNLITEAQTKWQKEASRREEIKSLDQSVKIIEPERILLESHFANGSDVVPYLNTLENLGTKVGAEAKVTSVKVSKDNNKLLVEMKATGSFESVYKFLTLLENSSYEMKIDFVDMHNLVVSEELKDKTKNTKWEMILEIKLLTFVL